LWFTTPKFGSYVSDHCENKLRGGSAGSVQVPWTKHFGSNNLEQIQAMQDLQGVVT